MPRPKKPARLWFDEVRGTWAIRDGESKIRTGCSRDEIGEAERQLQEYTAQKYEPPAKGTRAAALAIADVLLVYETKHKPVSTDSVRTKKSNLRYLTQGWAGKTVAEITEDALDTYIEDRPQSSARRELETLKAALQYWHESKRGPIDAMPKIPLPDKVRGRERYLTRSEAAKLLLGALGWTQDAKTGKWTRHMDLIHRHAARFILIGLHTGTRHSAILKLRWKESSDAGWVDIRHRVMFRRGLGEVETKKRRPKIRIGRKLLGHLRRWHVIDHANGPGPLTVVHWDGQEIDKLRRSWATACRLAGLDSSVTPHTLRHTRAPWMMQRGDDMWAAAGFLGMSMKTLQDTYGHHHPDFQDDVAE